MPRPLRPLLAVPAKNPPPASTDDAALLKRLQGLLQRGTLTLRAAAAQTLQLSGDLTVGGRLRAGPISVTSLAAGSITSPPLAGGVHLEAYLLSATTSIPNNALTTIAYDTVEGGLASAFSTLNGVLTVPAAGCYLTAGSAVWAAAVAANQYISLVKNGAEHRRMMQSSASHFALSGARVARCSKGDTLGIGVFQGSGAAVSLLNGPSLTSMSITYLGAL